MQSPLIGVNVVDIRKVLEAFGDETIEFCHIRTSSREIIFALDGGDSGLIQGAAVGAPPSSTDHSVPVTSQSMATPISAGSNQWATPPDQSETRAPKGPVVVAPTSDQEETTITASMVGIFYRAPNPESPPFVEIGSLVSEETTVGLIEAMKVFAAVPARVSGIVVGIDVQDGDFVEYGATVMRVVVDDPAQSST